MNKKKFKNHLAKLNSVYATLSEDEVISSLEKELLKKYLVNLFDALMHGDEESTQVKEIKSSKKEEKASRTERADRTPRSERSSRSEKKEESTVEKESHEQAKAEQEKEEPVEELSSMAEQKVAEEVVEAKVPVVKTIEKPTIPSPPEKYKLPAELLSIFEEEKTSELSDKLGLSKVEDIKKSMGINEKIFTIKELFGGDQEKFNATLTKIEACKDYSEATELLGKTIAKEENWADENKIKKAKQFVKLVQRKFQ